jgi:hypothetical protein
MDLVTTRRVGLGIAGATGDVASVGLRIVGVGWRSPLGAPARALAGKAERRGARVETHLLTAAADSLRSPLIDHVVRVVLEARLLERVAAEALDGAALERVLAVASERRAVVRVADVVLADDSLDRLVAHVLDQPAVDRVIERTLASRTAQTATDLLLASEELQRVVGHVARSEEVRGALHDQTHGLVDDMSDQLRDRTSGVDDRMEGLARRLLRRRAQPAPLASFDDGVAPA